MLHDRRGALLTASEPRDYRELRVKSFTEMCGGIQRVLGADDARERIAARNLDRARALADRFVLTHRTVSPGAAPLHEILGDGHLRARRPCTSREVDCGIERAVYFFLGCAAYPEGAVAFLVPSRVLERIPASYSPFDSGSLSSYARPRDPLASWDDPEKHAFLDAHLGEGADAVTFSVEYVAAHFADATDYVRRPQRSEPDFPTYHELVSPSGDRRAWSIEVRLHEDLVLDVDHIEAIVLGQPDLLADIPDELAGTVVIAEDEGSITSRIQQLIVGERPS